MRSFIITLTLIITLIPFYTPAQVNVNKKPCLPVEGLKKIQLPDVAIIKVESRAKDTIRSQEFWVPPVAVNVSYCRLEGLISKEIYFELFLPQQWNGRLLMSGNGGFAGVVQNMLVNYINKGYAVVGTNTGHKANSIQADWALNNMERQLNFGKLAVHRTAVVSKSIIDKFYCSAPSYSYFLGCSRGGGQAMMEAQQYPEDFNGIVAGAPAFDWPAIGAKFIRTCQANYPDPKDLTRPVITNDNLKLLQKFVFEQCDKLDGLSDQILNDPRKCKVDLSKLPSCPNDLAASGCFTKQQLEAIRTVYDPMIVDGAQIYPGFPPGLEAEIGSWDAWITGTSSTMQGMPSLHYLFGTELFKYFVYNDPSWNYSQYEFKNFVKETAYAAAFLNATSADYSALKKLNGKMIMYHGWNDPALSALATVSHYEEAMKKNNDLPANVRLFLLPGVLHCDSGTGPDHVDWVSLIQDWVEKNEAPERVVASKIVNGKTVMTRPVFPYPKKAVYNGSGDANLEKNFSEKEE
ncbi:MAG TPA: tannase/feruloyl esterase family alpha/beta hydrolase [Chitinophagaceae bacterium]